MASSTARSDQGSYRQFLKNANAIGSAGGTTASSSQFRMLGAANQSDGADSWWRITAASAFPFIADGGVVVDGSTQATNLGADSNSRGPEIELHGNGGAGDGVRIDGVDGTVIRDLVIRSFAGRGIYNSSGNGTDVSGSYIGTDAPGVVAAGNGSAGIELAGTDAIVSGNLISGNGGDGILVSDAANRARIVDNFIGTDATGNAALPNGEEGIQIDGADDVVIGEPGNGNVISGNNYAGINGYLNTPSRTVIQGNVIGVGVDGVTSLPNGVGVAEGGITVRTSGQEWLIGGTGTGEGNIIANNVGDGVQLVSANGTANDIAVLGNEIYGNTGLGLDIDNDGVTANDADDDDIGPNELRNFPVITAATESGGTVDVDFDLDLGVALAGDYRIEFFTNPNGVDATNGEGEAFASAVTISHGGTGSESFSHSFSGSAGDVLTATTTDSIPAGGYGNTSEFSAWYTVTALPTYSITGRVFEDADFAGAASAYDGGVNDGLIDSVDVELYDADDSDAFLVSTTTGRTATGTFTFSGLADGNYKVRVRSATIGDADSPPKGGLNGTVPGTWPYPLPEMTWANGSAMYGGQSASTDDADTGDDAGPGDTYVSVTVSGGNVTGVDCGFAYNLIVNTLDDGAANTSRSDQGSLRQFLKNANAIGAAGGTTANSSEFVMQEAANQSSGLDSWWRIVPTAALPSFSDDGTTLDASTLRANLASDTNSLGPEVELYGSALAASGLSLQADGGTVREVVINAFAGNGITITGASATNNGVFGCYIGTDAVGTSASANLDFGIWVTSSATGTLIGGSGAGEGNVISGNGSSATEAGISISTSTADVTILGNKIGTDRTGTARIANKGPGIKMSAGNGITIGGSAAGEGNIISGNGSTGINITDFAQNVTILGNYIGVGVAGNETTLGNTGDGIYVANFNDPSNIVIGGLGSGEGNVIARNTSDGIVSTGAGAGCQVLGNTIRHNSGYGLDSATDGLLAAGNLFVSNTSGVILRNDGGSSASNNEFLHNTVHGATSGPGVTIAGLGTILRNNIITGNVGYGISVTTGTMTESHNDVTDASTSPANVSGRSNTTLDATDLNVDPLFADSGALDFSLTECSSPCINVGLDLGGSQPDMNGSDAGLYNGLSPDQGAFETSCTGLTLAITKRAFLSDGTPIAHGTVLPRGADILYLLYISNPGPARTDVSLQDVLDPTFEYQSGTIRVDSSAAACISGSCTSTEGIDDLHRHEAGVRRLRMWWTVMPWYTPPGTKTIDAGNESAGNLQLDIPANSSLGLLFEVKVR
ncbi:MAG: right-handed parallel beta-helix repeat-containing protein [Candidatus Eisenbacteria bacterium]